MCTHTHMVVYCCIVQLTRCVIEHYKRRACACVRVCVFVCKPCSVLGSVIAACDATPNSERKCVCVLQI